jgi:thiamine pyrophosphate-dependent acetolactate synthase large subunit-like protein
MMTSSGKGIVPEDDPLSLGDGWMVHQLGRAALEEAACILAIGVRFGPLTTSWWRREIKGRMIQVDIDPTEIGKHVGASVGIVGDGKQVVDVLLAQLRDLSAANRPVWIDPVATREGRRAAIRERAPDTVATLEALRRVLPDDTLVFNDINSIACWGAGAYGTIKADQNYRYPGRSLGSDLRSPDFVKYAEAFGATGCRVDSVRNVAQAVAAAIEHDGPTPSKPPARRQSHPGSRRADIVDSRHIPSPSVPAGSVTSS